MTRNYISLKSKKLSAWLTKLNMCISGIRMWMINKTYSQTNNFPLSTFGTIFDPPATHQQGLTQFVLNLLDIDYTVSGRYSMHYIWHILFSWHWIRFYEQQCQSSSGCAWLACTKIENRNPIAGGRGGSYNLHGILLGMQ